MCVVEKRTEANHAPRGKVGIRGPGARLKRLQKVRRLRDKGYTSQQIADRLKVSRRLLHLDEAWFRDAEEAAKLGPPKQLAELDKDTRPLVAWDADAFERFYRRYSPYDYLPAHSKQIVARALERRRSVLNVPPGHAKSQVMAVWFPIWLICRDRNSVIVILSKTDFLARQRAEEIANELSNNEKLVKDFGMFKPETQDVPWSPRSGFFTVQGRTGEMAQSGSRTLQSRGSLQQIFGVRLTHLIVDDLVDSKNSLTPTAREQMERWFRIEVLSRFKGGTSESWACVIGTRFHPDDLYGMLIKDKRPDGQKMWDHIIFPAVLDWAKKLVLWPEEWPWDRLMDEAYVDVGADGFAQTYQQEPAPAGSTLVRREWVFGDASGHPGCLDLDRDIGQGHRLESGNFLPIVRVVSLDPPITRYAGLIVADLVHNREMFFCSVIECQREKMDVRDMLAALTRVSALYKPDYFVFEQNAAQRWFLQDPQLDEFRQRVRVIPHNTARNKGDPVLGIQSLAVDFEFGRVRLPYATPEARLNSEMLISEALSHPYGQTDDLLMSLWFLKFNYARLVPRNYGGEGQRSFKRGPGFDVPRRMERGWPGWQPKTERKPAWA